MSSPPPPMQLPPALLERYQLGKELGRGAMGVVYAAQDKKSGRAVALKVILGGGDPLYRARFQREAKVLGSIRHPGVLEVLDAGEVDGCPYLVTEKLKGSSLDEVEIDLDEATRISLELAEILDAVHEAGLLHRDLKPANLFLEESGRVVLIDFGLARGEDGQTLTKTGALLGTPMYFAPELWSGGLYDPYAEWWAFGVTCYCLAEGMVPFTSDQVFSMVGWVDDPELSFEKLSPGHPLRNVIEGCLRVSPEDRIQSADQVRAFFPELTGIPELASESGIGPMSGSHASLSSSGLVHSQDSIPGSGGFPNPLTQSSIRSLDSTAVSERAWWKHPAMLALGGFVLAYGFFESPLGAASKPEKPAGVEALASEPALRPQAISSLSPILLELRSKLDEMVALPALPEGPLPTPYSSLRKLETWLEREAGSLLSRESPPEDGDSAVALSDLVELLARTRGVESWNGLWREKYFLDTNETARGRPDPVAALTPSVFPSPSRHHPRTPPGDTSRDCLQGLQITVVRRAPSEDPDVAEYLERLKRDHLRSFAVQDRILEALPDFVRYLFPLSPEFGIRESRELAWNQAPLWLQEDALGALFRLDPEVSKTWERVESRAELGELFAQVAPRLDWKLCEPFEVESKDRSKTAWRRAGLTFWFESEILRTLAALTPENPGAGPVILRKRWRKRHETYQEILAAASGQGRSLLDVHDVNIALCFGHFSEILDRNLAGDSLETLPSLRNHLKRIRATLLELSGKG